MRSDFSRDLFQCEDGLFVCMTSVSGADLVKLICVPFPIVYVMTDWPKLGDLERNFEPIIEIRGRSLSNLRCARLFRYVVRWRTLKHAMCINNVMYALLRLCCVLH